MIDRYVTKRNETKRTNGGINLSFLSGGTYIQYRRRCGAVRQSGVGIRILRYVVVGTKTDEVQVVGERKIFLIRHQQLVMVVVRDRDVKKKRA